MGAIVDAELKSDKDDDQPHRISRAEARQADGEGLLDEANLTIWLTWYQLGGSESPPTITEIMQWPAAVRQDVLYLTRQLGEIRRTKKRQAKGKG